MESTFKQNCHEKAWIGTSMEDIYKGRGPWNFQIKPITASKYHSVLFQLPVPINVPPKPHYNAQTLHWDKDHVRMPYSSSNLYPVKTDSGEQLEPRWEIIQTTLLQKITSSYHLEAAIHAYNTKLPKFTALHYFFNEVLDEDEGLHFFDTLLPEIINLALKLPEIVPGNIPLLKQGASRSLSLSQLQVSCLLANAFLCTFPWRRDVAETYPGINFIRLYTAHLRPERVNSVSEKLKCICHYFRRVTTKIPTGVITFERKHLSKAQVPRWDNLDNIIGNTKLHITSDGNIEDNGLGLLQVDFANKYVGGGVLGYGCVQEEIRYVICPELIISRLFTEQLGPNEALLITGAERYSNYDGYGDSFTWAGDCQDVTPFDESRRRKTAIVAIDATKYNRPLDQFNLSAILRELNKAYVGFYSHDDQQLPAVATGNWGCGAFNGDTQLKSMIQLLACTAAKRDMVYYTFSNVKLRDAIYNMYNFLFCNQISIAQFWRYLGGFAKACLPPDQLYAFIQQAHFDGKSQPSIKKFFCIGEQNKPSTSNLSKITTNFDGLDDDDMQLLMETEWSDDEDIIESSQPEVDKKLFKKTKTRNSIAEANKASKIPDNHDEIVNLIDGKDTKILQTVKSNQPFLSSLDNLGEKFVSNNKDDLTLCNKNDKTIDDFKISEKKCDSVKTKTKITDYFVKMTNS